MQIIVLGMHRSGTSAVTGLLHLLGAHAGPVEIMDGATPDNPRGWWERNDVQALNNELLASVGCTWPRVAQFALEHIPPTTAASVRARARELVRQLDSRRPWVIKDPRFSLLLPLWRPVLERPVCVLALRHPIEVARSLKNRDHFPLLFGIALWEKYVLGALAVTRGLPIVPVAHQQLMGNPVATARSLLEQLAAHGVSGLQLPAAEAIRNFISPDLYRSRNDSRLEEALLNTQQILLMHTLHALPGTRPGTLPALSVSAATALQDYEDVERAIFHYQYRIQCLENRATELEGQLKQEKLLLQRHLEALLHAVDSVSESMSWRTVSRLTQSLRVLQGQPDAETAAHHLTRTRERIRSSLDQLNSGWPGGDPN